MDTKEDRKNGVTQKVQKKREKSREHKTPEQLWEEAGYSDNFIFRMVMDREDLCKDLLECLLNIKVESLEIRQHEKSVETDKKSKGIRLDLYICDSAGITYDIEIQTGMYTPEYFGKRTRYYQSVLDMELLHKGESYKKLGRTIIIFICTFDPFGKKLSKYTFRNVCLEKGNVQLGDDTEKIFFNAVGRKSGLTEEQRAFLDYVAGKEAKDDFTKRLDERVKEVKQDQKKRVDFMTWNQLIIEERYDAREEGREEGENKKAEKTAIKMLNASEPIQKIVDYTDLTLAKVKEIAKINGISLA